VGLERLCGRKRLGPDALGIDGETLRERLGRSKRAVKAALSTRRPWPASATSTPRKSCFARASIRRGDAGGSRKRPGIESPMRRGQSWPRRSPPAARRSATRPTARRRIVRAATSGGTASTPAPVSPAPRAARRSAARCSRSGRRFGAPPVRRRADVGRGDQVRGQEKSFVTAWAFTSSRGWFRWL
jgi:hypothetical protein